MLIAHAIPSGPDVYVCERTWLEIIAEGLPVIQEALHIIIIKAIQIGLGYSYHT